MFPDMHISSFIAENQREIYFEMILWEPGI
jgi:hypothetical protein